MIDLLQKPDRINIADEIHYVNQIKNKDGKYCREKLAFGVFHQHPLAFRLFLEGEMKRCKVEGCKQKYCAKGYCNKHYQRWEKWGNHSMLKYYFPTPELIAAKMKRCGTCKEIKSYSEFSKLKRAKDKHFWNCKKCRGINSKKVKKKFSGLYRVWGSMKSRCLNPNGTGYKYWGGRGITICEEWKDNFLAFYEWAIKNGHKKGLEVDRRNNDGNYCPENCRFVTSKENNRNNRSAKLTIKMVEEIKKLLKEGKLLQKEIGKMFDVKTSAINKINMGTRWADVKI